MRIYKRGKYYWFDYTFKGKRIRRSLGVTDRKSAKELAAIYVEQIRKGELGVIDDKPILFEDAVKIYLEEYYKNHVSPTTFKTEQRRANLLSNYFKGKFLHEITTKMVERYINMRLQYVKPATINREIAFLKGLYRKFNEWQYLKFNPMKEIRFLKEPPGRVRYLEEDELKRLFSALENFPLHFKAIVLLALYTGLRKGEILSLKWGDIDFNNEIITVTQTKNNERRVIPLNHQVIKILKKLPIDLRSRYVFVNPHTGKPFVDVNRQWYKLLKIAGIEDFRFHDLRHTFASYLAMSGESPLVIKELLGHKSLAMTQKYSHLSHKQLVDAIHKLQFLGTNMAQSDESRKVINGDFLRKNNWRRRASNPRHADYDSAALPAELRRLIIIVVAGAGFEPATFGL